MAASMGSKWAEIRASHAERAPPPEESTRCTAARHGLCRSTLERACISLEVRGLLAALAAGSEPSSANVHAS